MKGHISNFAPCHNHIGPWISDRLHLDLHQVLFSFTEIHELLCVLYKYCSLWNVRNKYWRKKAWTAINRMENVIYWTSYKGNTMSTHCDSIKTINPIHWAFFYLGFSNHAVKWTGEHCYLCIFHWCEVSFCLFLKYHAMKHRRRVQSTALQKNK